jgi:hypothetical protein
MSTYSVTYGVRGAKSGLQHAGIIALLVLAGLAAVAAPLFLYKMAHAASTTQVVTDSSVARQAEDTPPTKPWVIYTRVASPGTATFRSGPTNPPLGVGSLELATTSGSDKVYALNFDHVGTPLSSINAMSYSTYRTAGSAQQDTAINIQVDPDGPSGPLTFTTLVFEPVYNTSQGAVVSGQWQNWDAYDGGNAIWWSSNPIPGALTRDNQVTWDSILAANPNATILGGYGLNQGSGNPNLVVANDALVFGAGSDRVTYDFEPTLSPSDKDACKNGGWQTFNSPAFKNQGQCVSYTNKN